MSTFSLSRFSLLALFPLALTACQSEPVEQTTSSKEVEVATAQAREDTPSSPFLDHLLKSPRNGFFLLHFDGMVVTEKRLTLLQRIGDQALFGLVDQTGPRFRFAIEERPDYLILRMLEAEGDLSGRDYGLVFKAAREGNLEALALNYMASDQSRERELSLHWPWLWNANPSDPQGAFAIFSAASDEERDRSLAAIWAEGTFPHPTVEQPWTPQRAQEWVNAFQKKFTGLSETKLSASTPEELARLTEWLHSTGIRRVYLHTDTWRGEYWPRKASFVDVNPNVFPNGRSDLLAYRSSLEKKGMQLRLHSVSGGVGQQDPEFVLTGAVDERLSTWVRGEIARPVKPGDREILFRPESGSELPHVRLPRHCNLEYFRIGGEIVRVRSMEEVDQPVWRLIRVERAQHSSKAGAYPEGTTMAGLVSAYGQNYIPDAGGPLLVEMADRYARIINEAGLDHQHYDGAEIHNYLEPWGFSKFSYLVAQRLTRPVTSSTSGGRTVPWNLEYRFSKIRGLRELDYWSLEIPVLLDEHRPATDELDAHFQFADMLLLGAARIGFYKPEPMFGITTEMLDRFGLLPRYEAIVGEWGDVLPQIGEREKAWLADLLRPVPSNRLRQRGNHWQSQDVPVLERRGKGYAFVPVRVLHREGVDGLWLHGQEFGPIGPRQYLQPGEQMVLANPNAAQPPELSLQVLPVVGHGDAPMEHGAPAAPSEKDAVVDSYRTGADLAGREEIRSTGSSAARRLWPKSSKAVQPAGFTHLEVTPGRLRLRAENPTSEPVWEERDLPSWPVHLPIRGRRAIALDLHGDGSGAVVVLQLTGRGTRDYVVKLDFKGPRRVVIPNGEASWSAAYWGWRFDAKHFNYDATISSVKLGFGYLPPHTTATAEITSMDLLDNLPGGLVDPVIRVGDGSLRLTGEIQTSEYLTYHPERGAKVYDRNWNFLRDLPHAAEGWVAPKGAVPVEITHSAQKTAPWIALRLTTRGEPFPIGARPYP